MSGLTDEQRDVQRICHETLAALVRAQTGEGKDAGWINPEKSVEALTFLLAALIEALPETQTNRKLRLEIDGAAAELKTKAKQFRILFEESGQHALEAFGALATAPDDIPN